MRYTYNPRQERIERQRAAAMDLLGAVALGLMLAGFLAWGF